MSRPNIHLPFTATEFSITGTNTTYSFALPANPDHVLDAVPESAYAKDRFLPYWAENWPSAKPFFNYLLTIPLTSVHTSLELGCGLGLLSTALSIRNIFTVAIDISPESCQFAAHNIRTNSCTSRVVCTDWRTSSFKSNFDLVVASDVLYEQRWIPVILDCIDQQLSKTGAAWIADPCRRFWPQFKECAVDRGYRVSTLYRSPLKNSGLTVEIVSLTKEAV